MMTRRLLAISVAFFSIGLSGRCCLAVDPPFVLGGDVPKFDPPSREQLDKLKWTDNLVADGLELTREKQAKKGTPEVTAAEALKLRNTSAENNRKILDALGRLAPEDGQGVNFDDTMVRHVGGDMESTNPLFISNVTDMEFADLTGVGVLSQDQDFRYYAPKDIVVSWQTSEDSLVDKFVLRDDLTWSDGEPVTAHDFEFSYQVIMSNHPELIIPAVRSGTDHLQFVKAYDDHTLVFFHPEALATRLGNIGYPIIPKHIYEKSIYEDPSLRTNAGHTKQEDNPVVAGGYELAKRTRGQEIVLKRREGYYTHNGKKVREEPYFKEIRIKVIEDFNTATLALKAGDIHQVEIRPEQWESQTVGDDFYAKNTKVTAPEWTEFHFVWNCKSKYFSDKRVRWAMTYAMDYNELLETICHGLYQQGRGDFHPDAWMFPKDGPKPVEQDLDKAEDLLDEAGWTDSDGDGIRDKVIDGKVVPFKFQLMTYQTETGVQAATLMKETLEQIGVIANVKPTEFVVMGDKLQNHEFDASLGGWGSGSDPDSQENIWATGAPRNYGQYSNPKVDALFEPGRRELDRDKRAIIYGKIHMLLWDDQPCTWLFYRNAFYGFNKKLRGYNFGPLGPFKLAPGFSSLYTPQAQP